MRETGGARRVPGEYLIVAAALVPAAWLANVFWGYTLDDAFITLRYARNLADGVGPTYNADGPRAEGSTGFLWLVLMAVPHLLGVDAVVAAKLVGLAALAGSAAAAAWIAHQLADSLDDAARRRSAAFAAAILGAAPWMFIHAVSCMETALFTCAMTCFFAAQLAFARTPGPSRAAALASLALILGLTRPEGNLVAAAGLAGSFLLAAPRERRGLVLRALLLFVLPGALFFAWRHHYYGALFPLSFYLKVAGQGALSGLGPVMSYVAMIVVHLGVPILLGLTLLGSDTRALRRAAPALAAAVTLLVFMIRPAHIMGDYHRFLAPLTPLAAALAALGLGWLDALAARSATGLPLRLLRYGGVVLVAAGLLARVQIDLATTRSYTAGLRDGHVALGRHLRAAGRAHVLVIADAGAVPYYSEWHAIDVMGLNDRHIALTHDHGPAYVLDQRPDVIVLLSKSGRAYEPMLSWEKDLYDAALAKGMVGVGTLMVVPDRYYLSLLAWPDSAIGADLASWLPR